MNMSKREQNSNQMSVCVCACVCVCGHQSADYMTFDSCFTVVAYSFESKQEKTIQNWYTQSICSGQTIHNRHSITIFGVTLHIWRKKKIKIKSAQLKKKWKKKKNNDDQRVSMNWIEFECENFVENGHDANESVRFIIDRLIFLPLMKFWS